MLFTIHFDALRMLLRNVGLRLSVLVIFSVGSVGYAQAADCSAPVGAEGEIIFNVDHKVLQYCNGEKWVGMGWKDAAGSVRQLQYKGSDGKVHGADGLLWDDVNLRLGVGVTSVSAALDVADVISIDSISNLPADGTITEAEWGNYIVGSNKGTPDNDRRLRIGSVNNGYIFSEIELKNDNSLWGDIIFRTKSTYEDPLSNRVVIYRNGNVGIGHDVPKATLDVNGFIKMKRNTAQPEACTSNLYGSLAVTSTSQLCVCTNANAWRLVNTTTACTW